MTPAAAARQEDRPVKFEVLNRWTRAVQFTAEINCESGASAGVKMGLAVKWARANDAILCGAILRDAILCGAILRGADLRGAILRGADLRGASLRGADLCGADLRDADLRGAILCDARLRGADLRGAILCGAILCDADLRDADLRGADLRDADLRGADLRGADLRGADLRDADLRGADLRGASLLCIGNMLEIRTMQIDTWAIGYTSTDLQIGCQRHTIDKWRKWDSDAGRKWVAQMDGAALPWAERNLALVLQIIDANPATPKGDAT